MGQDQCRKAIRAFCCREKATAFCPPLPDSILVEAFKDLENQEKTKASYKKFNDNMKYVGGSMHALLSSQVPIFSLKEELVKFARKVREEGTFPL